MALKSGRSESRSVWAVSDGAMKSKFNLGRIRRRLSNCVVLVLIALVLAGCVRALRPYNQPSKEKLRLDSPNAWEYAVQVADQPSLAVPADGRVVVDVPRLERGCATYLFGVVKVSDSSPCDLKAIQLKKGGRVVARLSLHDLEKLPVDEQGFRVVRVK